MGIVNLQYYWTEKERKKLLSSINILIDTREQKNNHITEYLKKVDTGYKNKKLNFGDYSFFLPANPELGIIRDIYFNDKIAVERKNSLEELSSCFTQDRSRFEAEMIRATDCRLFLLIEGGSWEQIAAGDYRTQYNPKSFLASLMAFQHRYHIHIQFMEKELAGKFILGLFHYFLREYLK